MGLTGRSTGLGALDSGLIIEKQNENDLVVALAGNPNVGKSTVFNGLTGMKQHTGNWPGKTVTNAQGYCRTQKRGYVFVDLPGTYSILAHSAEEEVARNFICFGEPDATVVICDATAPERTLALALQVMECTSNVIIGVNLMDEAKRKKIEIDLPLLERRLGVPVLGLTARKKICLKDLLQCLDKQTEQKGIQNSFSMKYPDILDQAIEPLTRELEDRDLKKLNPRWLALKLLDRDESLVTEIKAYLGEDFLEDQKITEALTKAWDLLQKNNISQEALKDMIAAAAVTCAEDLCRDAVRYGQKPYSGFDRKVDRILTGRVTAYPLMLLLLLLVFFLTITVANYPSAWLSKSFDWLLSQLEEILIAFGVPIWLQSLLIDGILKVLCWVVSVMLPPMAIFFPLFTLLEDIGYLPRVAYNLDRPFHRCNACGKQSLTMWLVDIGMQNKNEKSNSAYI